MDTRTMRIGFDATAVGIAGSAHTGVYQYIYQLLREIGRLSPQSQLRLLFALPRGRHTASIEAFGRSLDLPNAVSRRSPIPSRFLLRWGIPVDLFTGPIDVFHAPAHVGYTVRHCPVVVTVHDLAHLRDDSIAKVPSGLDAAGTANWKQRRRFFGELAQHMSRSVAEAARVIAVSQFTADDLVSKLGVDPAKIQVVHCGVREEIRYVAPASRRAVMDRHDLQEGYFLYVGSLDPNKNLQTLIDGFAGYRRSHGRRQLVIAGHSHFFGPVLEAQCQRLGIASEVRFLGFVSDDDLPTLYSAARAVIMPSPLEGFGLPAIEAMACRAPVIGADAGALPEVIGTAGLLVRHDSPRAFGEALQRIEQDAALHAELVERGALHAAQYTWRQTARRTLAVYAEVADRRGRPTEPAVKAGSAA